MKDKAEMTKEELIALGWIKNPSDKMQDKAEKQLTAVEWFAKQVLRSRQLGFISNEKFNELLEQAKEMEKEQILAAHSDWSRITENLPTRSAEQYYTETFKSE